MLMSSRIRSGGSRRAASSASLPPGTGRTLYPRSLSMPASTWRLAGVSSTTRMSAGRPASFCGLSGFKAGSCCRAVGTLGRITTRSRPPTAAELPVALGGSNNSRRGRATGGRVPLPQGDSVSLLVVLHLVHEGADEHQAPPADPLEVGRVRGNGHRGAVEA